MIWARTEMPATNIILSKLNITASGGQESFELYHVKQVQIVDSQFHQKANYTNFWLFDAQVTFTNSSAFTNLISLYGLTTNSYGNNLAFYNSQATVSYTNLIDDGPLTMSDSILTISNNFTLFPTTVLNYTLDPNTNLVAVVGNLTLGGTINTTSGPGFGAGTNTLLTYTGTLSGSLPTLGSTPGTFTVTAAAAALRERPTSSRRTSPCRRVPRWTSTSAPPGWWPSPPAAATSPPARTACRSPSPDSPA